MYRDTPNNINPNKAPIIYIANYFFINIVFKIKIGRPRNTEITIEEIKL